MLPHQCRSRAADAASGVLLLLCAVILWAERPADAADGGSGPAIRSSRMLSHTAGGRTRHRVPIALNDNNDCGLTYTARRHWRCAAVCPDGVCDHRTHEPVWDYRWVGGPVAGEKDLLELELVSGDPAGAVLEIVSGAECIRLWPAADKGYKRDILAAPLRLGPGERSRKIYAEGIAPGTAVLRLTNGGGVFELSADVVKLAESQGGKRKYIYEPGRITVRLEPAEIIHDHPYYGSIVWSGEAAGKKGGHIVIEPDPGNDPARRRAVYAVTAEIVSGLTLEKKIRVRQKTYTGTPVAATTPERRREVESLIRVPTHGFKPTAQPNRVNVAYSQAWFEKNYTGSSTPGDPVKPIDQARLQYAAADTSSRWGVACCYRRPHAIFISPNAYRSGLKLEDLRGIAAHELRHMEHYQEMYNATGLWHVLCRELEHKIASYFMEADASSASLHRDSTWRYLHHSAAQTVKNYRLAEAEVHRLPSLPQRTAAVKVLQDIYTGLTRDMEEFKREDYECYIRPPRELDDR